MAADDDTGLLSSRVRRGVMDVLGSLPLVGGPDEPSPRRAGLTAAQLAERLGAHVTTIRFHVDQLVAHGLVLCRDERGRVGRPRRFYAVNPAARGDAEPDAYRQLAGMLADVILDAGSGGPISPADAAARWVAHHPEVVQAAHTPPAPAASPGAWLAKMGGLVDLLHRWGYSPAVHTGGNDGGYTARIDLHSCPLRDLAQRNRTVTCCVHEGVVRGALGVLGEDDCTVQLIPFVEPRLCVARLGRNAEFASQGGLT